MTWEACPDYIARQPHDAHCWGLVTGDQKDVDTYACPGRGLDGEPNPMDSRTQINGETVTLFFAES